jgi:acylphosphatase
MSDYATARVLISGRVTGVGFRYFVTSRAEGFNVAGYVRNLDTGSVEVMAEGERREVYDFLMAIRPGPAHAEVTAFQTDWQPYQKQFDTFFVKY